ncbi:MAG: DMT family transporter [Actinobacteria bacterium]|nr:DMT family transporter [Actinomycetota bacterium]
MWGASFVLMKDAIKRQEVNSFLFTRFLIAALVMFLINPRVSKRITKDLLTKGFLAGCFLAAGYIFQTLGLARTTAAVTGFLTGLYVIFTPLIAAVLLRHKITIRTWLIVAIATIGLGFLSIHGWSIGPGELLVLLSAIAYAAHFISLGQWSSGRDAYAMTIIQLATCALITGVISLGQGYQPPPDIGVWGVVIFTAVFATALAFMVQTWSQAHMTPTRVAVILTTEILFAAGFAIWFGGERLTFQLSIGGILVVIAMYMMVIQEA